MLPLPYLRKVYKMDNRLALTEREIKEIHHAFLYVTFCNHGTVGHNILVILHKFAESRGFYLDKDKNLVIPESVVVTEK